MSIGDTLARARQQAGLTVAQLSQRTLIREPIIRSIESGDFSACDSDFYARAHIRVIARVVGADTERLIREYDAARGALGTRSVVRLEELFTPDTKARRHRPGWAVVRGLALGLALMVGLGLAAYHLVSVSQGARQVAAKHVVADRRAGQSRAQPADKSARGTAGRSGALPPPAAHLPGALAPVRVAAAGSGGGRHPQRARPALRPAHIDLASRLVHRRPIREPAARPRHAFRHGRRADRHRHLDRARRHARHSQPGPGRHRRDDNRTGGPASHHTGAGQHPVHSHLRHAKHREKPRHSRSPRDRHPKK